MLEEPEIGKKKKRNKHIHAMDHLGNPSDTFTPIFAHPWKPENYFADAARPLKRTQIMNKWNNGQW